MSLPTDPLNPSALLPFSDSTVVFRAAKSKAWFSSDGKKGAAPAFYRRPLSDPHPDTHGLSVDESKEAIKDALEKKFHGFISLEVGDVRNLNLEVVRDHDTHGNITDGLIELPFRHPTDFAIIAESDRLAIALADISTGLPERIPDKHKR